MIDDWYNYLIPVTDEEFFLKMQSARNSVKDNTLDKKIECKIHEMQEDVDVHPVSFGTPNFVAPNFNAPDMEDFFSLSEMKVVKKRKI